MIDPNDPNNQNQNPNIINPTVQPNVQSNQPFQPRQRGTGFTNIKRVLGANVGAGQQLSNRIGGAITSQAQRVRQNLGQQQQQFQTGFQKSRQEALANIASATSLTKQPGESDEQYEARLAAQAPDYTQIGQNLRTAEYAGPTGFQNPNLLLSQAQTAGKIGSFARSGLGQGILARQYGAGRGTYTTGQNILDQMFLSQDPNAQRAIQEARQSTVGLGQTVQGAAAAAEETARATQEGVEQAKAQAAQDIQNSLGGIAARGTEAASQFYADRDRFNQLMTATKSTDTAGNTVYKDSAGNILSLTDRDYQLIDNPSQFGLDASNITVGAQNQQTQQQADARKDTWARSLTANFVLGGVRRGESYSYNDLVALANNPYPYGSSESIAYEDRILRGRNFIFTEDGDYGLRIPSPSADKVKKVLESYIDPTDTNITQGILEDIARSGTAANVGAIRYTPEQEAAARNLQLLSGNIPKAYTPFETDVYNIDSSSIANKSDDYVKLAKGLGVDPNILGTEAQNYTFGDENKVKIAQDYWRMMHNLSAGPYASRDLNDYWAKKLAKSGINIYSPTAYDFYNNAINEYANRVSAMSEEEATRPTIQLAQLGRDSEFANLGVQASPENPNAVNSRILNARQYSQLQKALLDRVRNTYIPKTISLQNYLANLYNRQQQS